MRAAKQAGMLACPGFFTPSEAFALLGAGADAIKLFPAEAASPAVLRGIRAVLPAETKVLPVRPGRPGFGIGSSIYKAGDTADMVANKAARLVAALPTSGRWSAPFG